MLNTLWNRARTPTSTTNHKEDKEALTNHSIISEAETKQDQVGNWKNPSRHLEAIKVNLEATIMEINWEAIDTEIIAPKEAILSQ